MRQLIITAAAAGGLSLTLGGTTALAGYCGGAVQPVMCHQAVAPVMVPGCAQNIRPAIRQAQNCQTPVVVKPGAPHAVDPIVMSSEQPMEYLRSVKFHNAPHVNIMRVHGQNSGIGLQDAPTGFTGGCHPSSTTYCGQPQAAAAPRPAPRPYIAPPVKAAPPAPVQYGSTALVRGTAYLPTSHVNRNYDAAVQVLNSGPIPARPAVNGGDVPHPSMFRGTPQMGSYAPMVAPRPAPSPMIIAPAPVVMTPAPAPIMQSAPAYGPGAGSWEKVSGPTTVGGLQATQVVCRRPAPAPAPVTCVRQPVPAPLMLAGAPPSHMFSRYGSAK